MTHLDLFSGIGGFALAAQTVWGSDYHCVGFCEIDKFCQQVLRKNFKGVNIYGDIRGLTAERLVADSVRGGCGQGGQCESMEAIRGRGENHSMPSSESDCRIDLLTGGFPCQPFSTAGKRKGTQDDRFLWPEMLRVIREVKPRWIIGENVPGIIEMALGQVVTDLEGLDYEVQCFVIPAVAVDAPHRRDRVWIVAHSTGIGLSRSWQHEQSVYAEKGQVGETDRFKCDCSVGDVADTTNQRLQGRECGSRIDQERRQESDGYAVQRSDLGNRIFPDWSRDWREVAALTCVHRMDDGLPGRVAGLPNRVKGGYRTIPGGEEGQRLISESKWRQEALKAYGNSIVPQVAMEIMRAIKAIDEQPIELKEWNETPC